MLFGAIWVPRSVTHFREIPKMVESENFVETVDMEEEYPIGELGEGYDGIGCVQFTINRDGTELVCRFTQLGMLAIEAPDDFPQARLLDVCEQIYIDLAKQKWVVLAHQLESDYIPFGQSTLYLDQLDPEAIFEEVCHDYLHKCLKKSREYDIDTQNERITDLLQRIKQAQSCYTYMHEVYGFDSPDLRQHIDYTHALVNMLYQNIETKSGRHREKQLRNLEIMVVILTVAVLLIELLPFLSRLG